jgi:hypothetical protein
MSKPRLVIPLSLQFSVRYVLRTGLLDQIREVADPVICLAWKDPALESELRSLGAEVHSLAAARWGHSYLRWRSYINVWHTKRMASPSAAIWERRADTKRTRSQRVRRRVRQKLLEAWLALPKGVESLLKREQALFWEDTNAKKVLRDSEDLRADAALSLTPYLPGEEMLLRALATKGVPMCTSILSFDNISTRGWIPLDFDRYLVWNRYNAAELARVYKRATPDRVDVVGAPQFDFYWDPSYIWGEAEWRREMRLPEQGPVILFGGGFYSCAPHEPQFLLQLDEAVQKKELPEDTVILFRNHPVDPIERWRPVLSRTKHTVHDDPTVNVKVLGASNIKRYDIEKLASCLCHSKVHVNVASTMTIDGSMFDRPQVGPAYDDTPNGLSDQTSQELYLQEHYLPIAKSGGVEIVRSRQELIRAVRDGLEHPERLAEGRRRLVREICTFDDGKATDRVARGVRRFLEQSVMAERYAGTAVQI